MVFRGFIATILACRVFGAPAIKDSDLAQMLANSETRQRAIGLVMAAPAAKLPVLIAWTQKPPAGVDEFNLRVGLMDALGELKSKQAIPFLVRNLSRQRAFVGAADIFMKTEESVESRIPAIAALIKIGPDSLPALYNNYSTASLEDKLATIIVVSRIAATMKDPSGPRGFLITVLGEANMLRDWAEEGSRRLASAQ